MSVLPNVIVAMVRCSRQPEHSFGIRIEEVTPRDWQVTWAFSMPAGTAAREGYDRTEIAGTFSLADGYPGCPACEQQGFAKCGSCSRLGCWESAPTNTCPWCGNTAGMGGEINGLRVGDDR